MKIGVISDTHIPIAASELPKEVLDAFRNCDLILHAGDLINLSILEELKKISKVEAVCGNMDSHEVRERLETKKILNIGKKKICIMHGYGDPRNLIDMLKKEFSAQKPDIVIFGHSHTPMNKYIDGTLFFNPGSPTDTIFAPYKSYGIIEIQDDNINAKIYRLD